MSPSNSPTDVPTTTARPSVFGELAPGRPTPYPTLSKWWGGGWAPSRPKPLYGKAGKGGKPKSSDWHKGRSNSSSKSDKSTTIIVVEDLNWGNDGRVKPKSNKGTVYDGWSEEGVWISSGKSFKSSGGWGGDMSMHYPQPLPLPEDSIGVKVTSKTHKTPFSTTDDTVLVGSAKSSKKSTYVVTEDDVTVVTEWGAPVPVKTKSSKTSSDGIAIEDIEMVHAGSAKSAKKKAKASKSIGSLPVGPTNGIEALPFRAKSGKTIKLHHNATK